MGNLLIIMSKCISPVLFLKSLKNVLFNFRWINKNYFLFTFTPSLHQTIAAMIKKRKIVEQCLWMLILSFRPILGRRRVEPSFLGNAAFSIGQMLLNGSQQQTVIFLNNKQNTQHTQMYNFF